MIPYYYLIKLLVLHESKPMMRQQGESEEETLVQADTCNNSKEKSKSTDSNAQQVNLK